MPKTLAGEPFRVSQSLVAEKVYELEGVVVSRFSVENFLSQSAEKFRRGTLQWFTIFGYRKSLDQGGGESRFSVENFLSHSAENIRRGNPLVFHLFQLSKKFA